MSETSGSDKLDDQSRAPTEERESINDAQTSNNEESLETALDKKRLKDSKSDENNNPDSASFNGEGEQLKPNVTAAVISSTSASSEPSPKIIAGPAQIRPTAPVVVGARVVTSSVQGPGGSTSLALVPQPGRVSVSSVAISQPRVTTLTTAKGAVVTLPRISTPSQSVPMTRTPQTVPLQLPANFQVPQGVLFQDLMLFHVLVYTNCNTILNHQAYLSVFLAMSCCLSPASEGMVLIRSDSGQLMLVSQQALAQAQAQGMLPKPASANAAAIVRPPSSQVCYFGQSFWLQGYRNKSDMTWFSNWGLQIREGGPWTIWTKKNCCNTLQ